MYTLANATMVTRTRRPYEDHTKTTTGQAPRPTTVGTAWLPQAQVDSARNSLFIPLGKCNAPNHPTHPGPLQASKGWPRAGRRAQPAFASAVMTDVTQTPHRIVSCSQSRASLAGALMVLGSAMSRPWNTRAMWRRLNS